LACNTSQECPEGLLLFGAAKLELDGYTVRSVPYHAGEYAG
jgi:hypothetical protein